MRPVIFLGGVPGCGKSTAVAVVRRRLPDLAVANAGELIRQGLGQPNTGTRLVVRDRDVAREFQEILITEAGRLRAVAKTDVLLDGHFAVPTSEGAALVPVDVFARIACRFLVQIRVEPSVVVRRLEARGGAKWWDGSISQIVELDGSERAHAEAVAAALRLPLIVAQDEMGTVDALLRALQS